jgi:hypothetical protein
VAAAESVEGTTWKSWFWFRCARDERPVLSRTVSASSRNWIKRRSRPSDASYHASCDHCTAAYLTQAGVANIFIHLADRGIHGNGHMMMLEKNSDAIAGVIEGWLKTLPVKPTGRSAQR